jgi:class 3 adenylate cyclase
MANQQAAPEWIRETFERYVSPQVVERMLANPSEVQVGGALQTVSIISADLRGYAKMTERLPPESLVDILNGHLAVAARAILAHEGTISQYAGDAVMAIFNAPLPQPDHALRAARAALRLGRNLRDYHVRLPVELRMHFGVGIETGVAVVGNIGMCESLTYTAVGDVVNLAQRLQELAGGGEILMAGGAHRAVNGAFQTIPLGPVTVRGRSEPVDAYSVREPSREEQV